MLSFKQILQSYDQKRQGEEEVEAFQEEGFLFSKIMRAKNQQKQEKNLHFTLAHSNNSYDSKFQSKDLENTLKNYLPQSIVYHHNEDQSFQYEDCLHSINENDFENDGSERKQDIFFEYQSELEMYKLEKATLIADIQKKTGRSVHVIAQEVLANIQKEVRQILTGDYDQMCHNSHLRTIKKSNRLQSTLGTPSSENQKLHHHDMVGNSLKPSPPPKIVEFTLGNPQNSSGGDENEEKKGQVQYQDVSEFFGGKLNGPMSKQIKNRVMKGNNSKFF